MRILRKPVRYVHHSIRHKVGLLAIEQMELKRITKRFQELTLLYLRYRNATHAAGILICRSLQIQLIYMQQKFFFLTYIDIEPAERTPHVPRTIDSFEHDEDIWERFNICR